MKLIEVEIEVDKVLENISAKDIVGIYSTKELVDEMFLGDVIRGRTESLLEEMDIQEIRDWLEDKE